MVHGLLDHLLVRLASFPMGARKYFKRSVSGPSWSRFFTESRPLSARLESPGQYLLPVQSQIGVLDPAYRVVQWKGAAFPTLIFHHDHHEAPFDFSAKANNTFKNLFLWQQPERAANWIVVRAPFHAQDLAYYLDHMADLSHYMAMLTGSVLALEHLVQDCRGKKNTAVYLAGAGLGGWAVNLHRTFFNTATGYVPLLAGAALGEVFVSGLYRAWTGALAREYPGAVRQLLDFTEAFGLVKTPNLFPLLARRDGIVNWQQQKEVYAGAPLRTLDKGHLTALMAPALLRSHLLAAMGLPAGV
jgi:hypothetical protein